MTRRPIVANAEASAAFSPGQAPWRLAIALALVAGISGVLLTGVSAWFLGAVALAGATPAALAFNFHFPAALVRLLALSRTVAKYGERLVGHRAALIDQVARRASLFSAMALAPRVRAAGWQLGSQDRLCDFMDDVEDVDYARLRVTLPAAVFVSCALALAAATAWLAPLALIAIAGLALAIAATIHRVAPRVRNRLTELRLARRVAGRRLGSALAAAAPLKAERAFARVLDLGFATFAEAGTAQRRQRHDLASLDALVGIAGPGAAISVFLAAWHAGARGNALLASAFLGFCWLALGEATQASSRVLLAKLHESAARDGLEGWTSGAAAEPDAFIPGAGMRTLALREAPRRAIDGRILGEPVSMVLRAGRPTALVGPSGVGKTTLLKQIAGWLGADDGGSFKADGVGMPSTARRAASHLCLHDAAVLSDTVRENLFAPQASDAEVWQALDCVELDERIREAGGLDAWIRQDMLSLGEAQRLNLARALLCGAPIVLFDEPTEHLDAEQARRILERIFARLSDRIVAYATHDGNAASDAQALTLA
jgi:ATP-binding cassette subfamily C protein CydC